MELFLPKMLNGDSIQTYFQKLNPQEKNLFRSRIIEGVNLKYLIAEKDIIHFSELKEKARQRLSDEINKLAKISQSKEVRRYALRNVFQFKIEDYLISLRVTKYGKKKVNFSLKILLEIHTPRGKLYLVKNQGNLDNLDILIAGHLFDRYLERLGLVRGGREEAIYHFLRHYSVEEKILTLDSEGYIKQALGKGLALGNLMHEVILLKTYVSEDIVSLQQKETVTKLNEIEKELAA